MFLEVLHFRKPHVYGVHIYIYTLYVYNVHMINERIRWHHERAWKIVHWFCIYHPCGDNITMIYNDHMHANRVYNLFSNVFGADEVRATEWIFYANLRRNSAGPYQCWTLWGSENSQPFNKDTLLAASAEFGALVVILPYYDTLRSVPPWCENNYAALNQWPWNRCDPCLIRSTAIIQTGCLFNNHAYEMLSFASHTQAMVWSCGVARHTGKRNGVGLMHWQVMDRACL